MNKFVQPGKFRKAASPITAPENSGLRFILNPIDSSAKLDSPVNDLLAKRWKEAKIQAKSWYANRANYKLGEVQTVAVQSDVWVVNLLVVGDDGSIDEKALEKALKKVSVLAKYERATIHTADQVLELSGFENQAKKQFLEEGLSVWVYKTANTPA